MMIILSFLLYFLVRRYFQLVSRHIFVRVMLQLPTKMFSNRQIEMLLLSLEQYHTNFKFHTDTHHPHFGMSANLQNISLGSFELATVLLKPPENCNIMTYWMGAKDDNLRNAALQTYVFNSITVRSQTASSLFFSEKKIFSFISEPLFLPRSQWCAS